MSVPMDGPPYDFTIAIRECPLLFAAGETPEFLIFDLQGIIKGPLAAGGDPSPPNGVRFVINTGICRWLETIGGIGFGYINTALKAEALIEIGGGVKFFEALNRPSNTLAFDNDQQNPAVDKYYGGHLNVSYEPPVGDKSIVTIADPWKILPGEDTFCTPRPFDDVQSVYAYQQREGRTNISIKMDNP